MVKLIKTVLMAGLGLEAKVRKEWDELVRRGEESQTDCAKKVKSCAASLEEKERDLIDKVTARLPIATKSDLDRLEKKIQELSAKLKSA
ncbi:MAG: hypothetical protein AABY46_07690 [Nitrospirota bacterium]